MMPNMSYCRFRNTLQDLRACYEHMDDEGLSSEEKAARKHLVIMCNEIASDYMPDGELELPEE
jgi:hypothetical protein